MATAQHDFYIKLDSTTQLSTLLSSISFKQKAQIQINTQGLKFSIHDQQCLQLIAYFNASSATEYYVQGDLEYIIDLSTLNNSLTIFGSGAEVSCTLSHESNESVLTIQFNCFTRLDDSIVSTTCDLVLFDFQQLFSIDEAFFDTPVPSKIILGSRMLKSAFMELDSTCQLVTFTFSFDPQTFIISSQGIAGTSRIEYPNTASIFDSYQSTSACSYSYQFSMIQTTFKPLSISDKTSIRINENGILCMQFKVPFGERDSAFIDIYLLPLIEDDDDG